MTDEPEKKRRRRRRRRRRDDPDRAGFAALLPQILTTGNLAAGFYAIVKASSGDVLIASYAIFVAALFDILDGRAARMTGNVSRFGAEYDSIADTVSFGVAPAVLAFYAGDFASLGWAGWVMAFTYTVAVTDGALNLTIDERGNTIAVLNYLEIEQASPARPTVQFRVVSSSVSEGVGSFTIAADLSATRGGDVTVPLTLSGSATEGAGNDYTISSTSITIPAGDTSASVTISELPLLALMLSWTVL